MADIDPTKTVSIEELMLSTLAMTDALAKLLVEKGHQPTSCAPGFESAGD